MRRMFKKEEFFYSCLKNQNIVNEDITVTKSGKMGHKRWKNSYNNVNYSRVRL